MGVRGLTTYLRENQRALSQTHHFTAPSSTERPTRVVIDGWSFIYQLHFGGHLPWVYGGEYESLVVLVQRIVRAWISVGLKLYFVFDGADPILKYPTIIERITRSNIHIQLLFFRTSHASRSTPQFLHDNSILPPFSYAACLHALESLQSTGSHIRDRLEIHFADEEADPYAVELAGRIHGYVAAIDSDFVILNQEGYKGYIPFDEIVWTTPVVQEEETTAHEDDVDDDFQVVTWSKAKKKKSMADSRSVRRGVIPPDAPCLTMSFVSYTPARLAAHFDLPVSLLPLLGSFIGNDFSKQKSQKHRDLETLFFDRRLSLSQRAKYVAATLRSTIAISNQSRKQRERTMSVMDLIEKTVNALLSSWLHTMSSSELQAVIENVVQATLQYAIPKAGNVDEQLPSDICFLHEAELCPLLPFFSRLVVSETLLPGDRTQELMERNTVRQLYITAYRRGKFTRPMMNVLSTGNYWVRFYLENPDVPTSGLTIGSRLRSWVYAILDDALGLPDIEEEEEEEESEGTEPEDVRQGDEEEIVDVAEEDSDDDMLAPLRGELRRLHLSDDVEKPVDPPKSTTSSNHSRRSRPSRPKTVTEYMRRGTRVATTVVTVPSLSELLSTVAGYDSSDDDDPLSRLPLQLRPEEARLSVLLHATESDTRLVRALPPDRIIVALAVRWVAQAINSRIIMMENGGGGSKDREHQWTVQEAQGVLASFTWERPVLAEDPGTSTEASTGDQEMSPPIEDRHVQLMSQLLMALDTIQQLVEILLLTNRVEGVVHRMSGKRCYQYWTGVKTVNTGSGIPEGLWAACVDGLEGVFVEHRRRKIKKERKDTSVNANIRLSTGLFGILHSEELD